MSTESPDLARLLLKEEIEAFLYREAERLDERRYEDWPFRESASGLSWVARPAGDQASDGAGTMRNTIRAVLVSILLVAEPAVLAAEWVVKPGTGSGCLLESSPESLSDGYQTTTARLRVDGKTVSVASPSVFDTGFNDIGVVVDEEAMVPMDRTADSRTAVFESRYSTLVEQFKRGLRARVQLRFWPTWPATGTHSATFSLIGFTRAFARLDECN